MKFTKNKKELLGKVAIYTLAVLIAIYVLGPIIWLVLSSFCTDTQLVRIGKNLQMPTYFTLGSYREAFFNTIIGKSMMDTTIYSIFSSIIVVGLASLAAYPFAFLLFPFKRKLFVSLLAISAIPGWSVAIPLFIYIRRMGLFDTYAAIIFAIAGFLLPFAIWMLIGFLKTIPAELLDAALVDGCSPLGALVKVILPLAAPGVATILIWAFLLTWGEFGWPLILTSSRISALPVTISSAVGIMYAKYSLITAQGTLALIVPVIIAVIFQKYLIRGLTMGAIK